MIYKKSSDLQGAPGQRKSSDLQGPPGQRKSSDLQGAPGQMIMLSLWGCVIKAVGDDFVSVLLMI